MDWQGLMRLGLAELRLDPAVFWALTPVELLILAGRDGGTAPMARAHLDALAARYPDETGGRHGR